MAKSKSKAKGKNKTEKSESKSNGGGGPIFDRKVHQYETSIIEVDGKKKRVIDSGDRVAKLLRGASIDQIGSIASENDIEFDPGRYANPGIARMSFGNRLRGMVRRGESVKIGGQTVASL